MEVCTLLTSGMYNCWWKNQSILRYTPILTWDDWQCSLFLAIAKHVVTWNWSPVRPAPGKSFLPGSHSILGKQRRIPEYRPRAFCKNSKFALISWTMYPGHYNATVRIDTHKEHSNRSCSDLKVVIHNWRPLLLHLLCQISLQKTAADFHPHSPLSPHLDKSYTVLKPYLSTSNSPEVKRVFRCLNNNRH